MLENWRQRIRSWYAWKLLIYIYLPMIAVASLELLLSLLPSLCTLLSYLLSSQKRYHYFYWCDHLWWSFFEENTHKFKEVNSFFKLDTLNVINSKMLLRALRKTWYLTRYFIMLCMHIDLMMNMFFPWNEDTYWLSGLPVRCSTNFYSTIEAEIYRSTLIFYVPSIIDRIHDILYV